MTAKLIAFILIVVWVVVWTYALCKEAKRPTPSPKRICDLCFGPACVWCVTHAVYLCRECVECKAHGDLSCCTYLSLSAAKEYAMKIAQWKEST